MGDSGSLLVRQLLIENLDPNEVYVNNDLYDNNDIEVRYAQALIYWRWTRGWRHAMGMMIMIMGIIAIHSILYFQDRRIDYLRLKTALANRDKYSTGAESGGAYVHRSFIDRISTHLRSVTYKRTRGRWFWKGLGNMSLGLGLTIFVVWLYPTLYVFVQHPYYLKLSRYGPPGLAGRGGMIAVSLTPFIYAMTMKANLISLVTGVGHEKLNVVHRWLAALCFYMALVHTIPFLVEPVRDGGYSALREKITHGKGHMYYVNGLTALACLAYLNLASMPFMRHYFYEFFKRTHVVAAILYLAMLFWHCNNKLTSWHYLWTAAVIWVVCLAYRIVFRTNWFSSTGSWFSGDTARFSRLTDDGVKITIATKMKWKPGQHVFIRIPALSWLDNHPFTVASVVNDDDDLPSPCSGTTTDTTTRLGVYENKAQSGRFGDNGVDKYNEMELVFKPYKGFTRRMFDVANKFPDLSYKVLLDGPYGGMPRSLESFDTVLLIAGGSGITAVVAHLKDLCRKIKQGKAVTQDVRIVWTVKRFESLEWFKDEISVAARSVPFGVVHCQYFVTEESPVEFCDYPVSATQQWPTSPNVQKFPSPTDVKSDQHPSPGAAVTTAGSGGFPSAYPQYPPMSHSNPYQPQAYSSESLTVPHAVAVDATRLNEAHPNSFSNPVHAHGQDIKESHPDPFTTPVHYPPTPPPKPEIGIADSHPNPFSTPTGYPVDKKPVVQSMTPNEQEYYQPHPQQESTDVKRRTSVEVHHPSFPQNNYPVIPRKPQPAHDPKKPGLSIALPAPEGEGAVVDGIVRQPVHQRQSYGPGDFGDEVMIEFGRPRLREGIRPWAQGFGRRTCIYVCGPESMRVDVSNAVASLQMDIWREENLEREEVYLHTENFTF